MTPITTPSEQIRRESEESAEAYRRNTEQAQKRLDQIFRKISQRRMPAIKDSR